MKSNRALLILGVAILLIQIGIFAFLVVSNSEPEPVDPLYASDSIFTAGYATVAYKWKDPDESTNAFYTYHVLLQRYSEYDGQDHYYDVLCDEEQFNFAEIGNLVDCEWYRGREDSFWIMHNIEDSPNSNP